MSNERHLERRETIAYWPVEDAEKGEALGIVSDMSAEGIQIHSKHSFKKGEVLTVTMKVDKIIAGTDSISLVVENVWCSASEMDHLYHAGFKTIDISDRAKSNIQKMLTEFSYVAPE